MGQKQSREFSADGDNAPTSGVKVRAGGLWEALEPSLGCSQTMGGPAPRA